MRKIIKDLEQKKTEFLLQNTKNTLKKDDVLGVMMGNERTIFTVFEPSNEEKLIKDGFQKCKNCENTVLKEIGIEEILEGTAIAVVTGQRKIKISTKCNGNWVKPLPING